MLSYRVEHVTTGVYIQAPEINGEETLSVSGNRQVTLHCAGDLISDPFPFNQVVYAPFYNTLYATCVADDVRAQFGAAVQRAPAACRSVPRRATLLHGDPVSHAASAFYQVVRLAAEDVERIGGALHAESPYECVFNAVRVYPWGEEDVLAEALRAGDASGAPAAASSPPPTSALWKRRATVALQTPVQHRLLLTVLKRLCNALFDDERSEASACVFQVRLAVYAGGGCSGGNDAKAERVLRAEHLFTLIPSIGDVCRSFGTTMEALCEALVCRREGNLLDNPLLPVVLPGVAIEGLTVLTCISAKGKYASRPCIDACCFGCSSEREQRVAQLSPLRPACTSAKHDRSATKGRRLFCPPANPLLTSPFQKMTSELLSSVGPHGTVDSQQRTQSPQTASLTLSPGTEARTHSSRGKGTAADESHRTSSPLSYIDDSVDRILAHHHFERSPGRATPLEKPSAPTTPSQRPLRDRVPFSPCKLRKQREEVARQTEEALMDRVRAAEERAEAAAAAARERTAEARRRETEALERSRAIEESLTQMRHTRATEEAVLLVRQKVLQLSCTDLEAQEQRLAAAVAERRCVADELERAAQQLAVLEPQLQGMRAEAQRRSQCAVLQQRHDDAMDKACSEYACALAAKVSLLDAHARLLADGVCLDAWESRLSQLQRQCGAQEAELVGLEQQSRAEQQRVEELRREECELQCVQDGLHRECERLQRNVAELEWKREEQQRHIAAEMRDAADAQEKALKDYDDRLAVLRRLKGEEQALRRQRDELCVDCERQQCLHKDAKEEVENVRKIIQQLRNASTTMERNAAQRKEEIQREEQNDAARLDALRVRGVEAEERERRCALRGVEAVARAALVSHSSALRALAAVEERERVARAEQDAREAVQAAQALELQQLMTGLAVRMADTAGCVAAEATAQQNDLQEELKRLLGERKAATAELAELASQQAQARAALAQLDTDTGAAAARLDALRVRGVEVEGRLRAAAEGGSAAPSFTSDQEKELNEASPIAAASVEGSVTLCRSGGFLDVDHREAQQLETVQVIVAEELRKVIEELADATDELAEVEDTMIEETDKSLLAFRRCDGELTLRVERLMDRCASFMDVESRLMSRAPSSYSSGLSRFKRLGSAGGPQ